MINLTKQADTIRNKKQIILKVALSDMEIVLFRDPVEIWEEIQAMTEKQTDFIYNNLEV